MMLKPLHRILLWVLLLVGLCGVAQAATITLPRTGQTGCWDASGAAIACAGTGQDGDKLKGAAWPATRFTDQANGTLRDNLTGLVWLKDANCFGAQAWSTALTSSNNLASGACSLADSSTAGQWRLPNRKELLSLVNRQQANNATWLGTQGFSNVQTIEYWTSTSYSGAANYKWYLQQQYGYSYFTDATVTFAVWPVRDISATLGTVPSGKEFGNVGIGSAAGQRVLLSNSAGPDGLPVRGISVAGSDAGQFYLDTGDASNGTCGPNPILEPGGSCTVTVWFVPTSSGAKSAELQISSPDPVTPLKTVALTGSGIDLVTSSLVVTMAGTGSGSVYSNPVGMACSSGICLAEFVPWTTLALTAVPDSNSTFGQWSEECSGTADCTLLMSTNRYVTANFNLAPRVKVGSVGYDSLAAGYAAAGSGAVIMARELEFAEQLLLNNAEDVTLKGGFNAAFSNNSGLYSTLIGSLTIGNGSLTVENLIVR